MSSIHNIKYAVVLFLWGCSGILFAQDGSVSGDRQALEDLYEATGGDSWDNNSGWLSGEPSDSWHGVEVDAEGRVVELDLSGNNLSGELPETIGNLTRVRYFNVKQNELVGEIPSSIGNMVSLTHLLLNGVVMDMQEGESYHPGKEVSGFRSDERTNTFSGQLPSSIGNLTELLWFELSGRGSEDAPAITGPVPSEIGNLTKLKGFQISWNKITELPRSMENLTDMVHIGFENQWGNLDNLSNGDLAFLEDMTNLHGIFIEDNAFNIPFPDLSNLTGLHQVLIKKCGFSGSFPEYLIDGSNPDINMVEAGFNNFGGSFPAIGTPNNLTAFTITSNGLTGEIHPSWGTSNAEKIVNFGFGYNELEGEIPDLSHMYKLRFVAANDNNFTGPPPMVDTSNEDLKNLHLQNNQMSGQVEAELAEVGNLPKFEQINLSSNQFTDTDLEPLIDALEDDGNLNVLIYNNQNATTKNSAGETIKDHENNASYAVGAGVRKKILKDGCTSINP
jgi:Leucine-rich repeat (LRR) protein